MHVPMAVDVANKVHLWHPGKGECHKDIRGERPAVSITASQESGLLGQGEDGTRQEEGEDQAQERVETEAASATKSCSPSLAWKPNTGLLDSLLPLNCRHPGDPLPLAAFYPGVREQMQLPKCP